MKAWREPLFGIGIISPRAKRLVQVSSNWEPRLSFWKQVVTDNFLAKLGSSF